MYENFKKYFNINNKIYLNESYGVSEEINKISSNLFAYVKEHIENCKWKKEWVNLKEIEIKEGSVIFEEKYNLPINYATYIIYNVSKEDIDKIGIQLEYEEDTKSISIVWHSINKDIDFNRMYEFFEHEIMHCYQHNKGMNLTSKLYNSSRKIINGSDENKTIYMLAQLIYWLSKPEIYAHCQQFYEQLLNNKPSNYEDIKKCETYKELEYIKKLVNHLNANDGTFNYYHYFPEYFNNINYIELRRKINISYNYAIHKLSRVILKYLNKEKLMEKKISPFLKIIEN